MVFGVLEQVLYQLSIKVRKAQGRKATPSLLIVEAQAAKTEAGISEQTGYDAHKTVKGRKRHIAVDTQGNVMAVGITAASVHDKTNVQSIKEDVEDLQEVTKIVADGAYKGTPAFTAQGRIEWQIVDKKATGGIFKVLPKRWIVERSFAWLSNFRRLSKDYEKSVLMSKAMIIMSAICITLNKLTTYF
jgi:putative transposase